MGNIPIANPSRELEYISNFNEKLIKQLKGGIYVGGESVNNFEKSFCYLRLQEYSLNF